MSLQATLTTSLQGGPLGQQLLDGLAAPVGDLAIDLPLSTDELTQIGNGAGQLDTAGIGGAVSRVAEQITPLLSSLPGVGDLLGPLESTLQVLETAASGDLPARFRALADSLTQEMQGSGEGGFIGKLMRVARALESAPEGRILFDVLRAVTGAGDLGLQGRLPVGDALQAIDGTVRAIGGLMALESVLAESERLTSIMAGQLDADDVRAKIAALEATLSGGTTSLADFIAGVSPEDPAAVAAAIAAVRGAAAQLEALDRSAGGAMGFGEATLVYLDVETVSLEIEAGKALVRSADLGALGRAAQSLATSLAPLLAFDVSSAATQRFDDLLEAAEGRISELAASISGLDLGLVVDPLTTGIETISGLIARVSDVIGTITVTFRAAMTRVRDAVAALPFGDIADAVRSFLEPITTVIEGIRTVVASVEAALDLAAKTVTEALGKIDGVLESFKLGIDNLFAEAKKTIEALHIDDVVGAIAGRVQEFADVLAKAQMRPYFDTAVGAIGTTADVISAIPFGMLPDSMKSQVDDAVRPIKETDARAVEAEIEALLQISADGKFELRGTIVEAVAEIQEAYKAVIDTIEEYHPRNYLNLVEKKLADIAEEIRKLSPALTLAPLQEAVDKVKAAIASVDLDAALQPVRDVFDQITSAIDQYSPTNLLKPVEDRIVAAREALFAETHFRSWAPAIDELVARAEGLFALLDPTRLGKQLESCFDEAFGVVNAFPDARAGAGLGTLVAALLDGAGLRVHASSFGAVLRWLDGGSGTAELNGRAERVSDAVARTLAAVESLDIAALAASIAPRAADVTTRARALSAALPEGSAQRESLDEALGRFDAGRVLGDLAQNRTRYLVTLRRSGERAETLRRTGFSEADVTLASLREALAPLRPLADIVRSLITKVGLSGIDQGVNGVVRSLLTFVPPARLAALVMPIFLALRDRIHTLLTAVATPLKDGIARIDTLIHQIDLKPLTDAMDLVVTEVKEQILALHPDTILGEPLAAFRGLQNDLAQNDPVAKITHILEAVRDAIEKTLRNLDFDKLLESPLAIYDHILAELRKLNVEGLLDPILDQLDNLAKQVDEGLDETVTAFERLQNALPGGGGGGGGSASASLSVG